MSEPRSSGLTGLPTHRLLAEFSMWSGDLVRLADDVRRIEPYADLLHIDVADGHFAPALLFFPDLVARIRPLTRVPLHVHLMVEDRIVLSQIDQFAEAGADLISLHVENESVADAALSAIARHGLKAGLVARVETPVERLAPYLERLDFVTLLGTAIGVKGQGLDPTATARLVEAGTLIARSGRPIVLAADGGIREQTVPLLRAAGAGTVVLGSLAFGAPDLAARIAWLHALPPGSQGTR